MAPSTVTLSVTRYRPEQESEPAFQTYEIPYRKDWVILDALNHVKDTLDGSLSFRWSCRMGVCGSCGMKVNGTPKLTCATFLSDYAPGPIRVEPLDYFPVVRDLVVDITDFVHKLKQVKPWIIREDDTPTAAGEYLQTPEQLDAYKQFSMCINCMLCYSACPIYGARAELHRPRRHRARPTLQLGLPGRGGAGTAQGPLPARRDLAMHLRGRVHPGVPQARGSRRAPSSSTSSPRRPTGSSRCCCPWGAR